MQELFQDISSFWQGFLSSILATLTLAIISYLLRIWSRQVRESRKNRRKELDILKTNLSSIGFLPRLDASLVFIFQTMKYLMIGNILWVLPEALGPVFQHEIVYLLKFVSLGSFGWGLRWIYLYTRHKERDLRIRSRIIKASYGVGDLVIDVTRNVIQKIELSETGFILGNDIARDPCPGKIKTLKITYSLDGVEYVKDFQEGDFVKLP